MNIGRAHRGHLAALDIAYPSLRMQHEDSYAIAVGDRVDRRRARVPARRADYGEIAGTARKELFKQPAQQLQRDVLERECRAVEQFEQPVLLIELHERGHRVVAELTVGLLAKLDQLLLRQAVADKGAHDLHRQHIVAHPAKVADFFSAKARPLARQVQPAVTGEASQRDAFEIERGRAAPGRDIFHRMRG